MIAARQSATTSLGGNAGRLTEGVMLVRDPIALPLVVFDSSLARLGATSTCARGSLGADYAAFSLRICRRCAAHLFRSCAVRFVFRIRGNGVRIVR